MRFPEPVSIINRRVGIRSWILAGALITFAAFTFVLLFLWIAPSLDGHSEEHIAADSGAYMSLAGALRDERTAPAVAAVIFFSPNTLLVPVLLAWALNSVFAIALANYAMFFVALALLKKSFSFSTGIFLCLLLFNATTVISLITVNKEIVDLLAVSMFLFAHRTRKPGILLLALLIALLNRFETCAVMLVFLFAASRFNPLRERRGRSLVVLIIGLSIALPVLAPGALSERFGDVQGGFIATWLDTLEVHYLYSIAVIPKIAQNLLGALINIPVELDYLREGDIANSVILFSNNLADAIVLLVLWRRRMFNVRKELFYFAAFGCVIVAVSPLIQVRYFYFAYVVLCLQAAQNETTREPADFRKEAGTGPVVKNPEKRVLSVG